MPREIKVGNAYNNQLIIDINMPQKLVTIKCLDCNNPRVYNYASVYNQHTRLACLKCVLADKKQVSIKSMENDSTWEILKTWREEKAYLAEAKCRFCQFVVVGTYANFRYRACKKCKINAESMLTNKQLTIEAMTQDQINNNFKELAREIGKADNLLGPVFDAVSEVKIVSEKLIITIPKRYYFFQDLLNDTQDIWESILLQKFKVKGFSFECK